jgi:hypothetical protein
MHCCDRTIPQPAPTLRTHERLYTHNHPTASVWYNDPLTSTLPYEHLVFYKETRERRSNSISKVQDLVAN